MTSFDSITHRTVRHEGVSLHVAEAGPADGPVVLLVHGFPECWYSWRHQLLALAADGYRAVAFDQRGFARSDAPQDRTAYTTLHHVGDVVSILDDIGADTAVVVGHDWGAPTAWNTALLRPDRVSGVVGLSVPHGTRFTVRPTDTYLQRFGPGYYMLYFQTAEAEAELDGDLRSSIRRMLIGDAHGAPALVIPPGGGLMDVLHEPSGLPKWITADDLGVYESEHSTHGLGSALNFYRNLDRNWELTAPWAGMPVQPPALFLAGEHDRTISSLTRDGLVSMLGRTCADVREVRILAGAGHWLQQERAAEISEAISRFAADPSGYGR